VLAQQVAVFAVIARALAERLFAGRKRPADFAEIHGHGFAQEKDARKRGPFAAAQAWEKLARQPGQDFPLREIQFAAEIAGIGAVADEGFLDIGEDSAFAHVGPESFRQAFFADTPQTPDTKNYVFIAAPFIFGFSTSLVLALLNRFVEAIKVSITAKSVGVRSYQV
jgi:hypothetical protein